MSKGKVILGNRWLVVCFCVLGGLAIFLAVINITIWVTNSNYDDGGELSEEETVVIDDSFDDGVITDEDLQAYIEETSRKISEVVIDDEKVNIYKERVDYLASNSEFGVFADQMIADCIAIDDIEQSVDSAAQVANTASVYGKDEIAEKYLHIMKQRMKDQGINEEVQGIG